MSLPLGASRVCILRASHYSVDNRARKQADALTRAGATVSLIGLGDQPPGDLADLAHEVLMLPLRTRWPGRASAWRPLRVAVNLTCDRLMEWWPRLSLRTHSSETDLVRAASAFAPDVVHAYNIHTLGAAVRVKRRTGARVVYDCRDLSGDVDYGSARLRSTYRALEAKLIPRVDAVIVVSEPAADVLERRHGIPRPLVVYNGPAAVTSPPTAVHRPLRLLFQGSFHANRNLHALIDAMRAVRGEATLTLQGFGGVERELRAHIAASGLKDVVSFVPPVQPQYTVHSATAHDVGIACYKGDSLNLRCAVPNKLMDYLGAGLAVIASDLPGHRSVLEGTGAGALIDPSSADTIAAALRGFVHEHDRVAAMKQAASRLAERYQWSREAAKLVHLHATLLRPEGGAPDRRSSSTTERR